MSDLIIRHTQDEAIDSLAAYLPGGELFESAYIPGTNFNALLAGLSGELLRAENFLFLYNSEFIPDDTTVFIEEWEAAVGIPDDCFSIDEGDTNEQRRTNILVKLASLGVQTGADFVNLATILGFTGVEVLPGVGSDLDDSIVDGNFVVPGVTYSGNFFDVGTQEPHPTGLVFNDDGLNIFISGNDPDAFFEYDLTTPYSLASGVSYSGFSFNLPQDSAPLSLAFNDDGLKLFMIGNTTDRIYEYHLTTAYSLASGVSYSGNSFSVTSQESTPTSVIFNDDGLKLFIVGFSNDTIFEYDLTTAYSLASGVSYSGNSFNVASQLTTPTGLVFNNNGLRIFVIGNTTDTIFEYHLTTPYSLASGVSYSGNSFNVGSEAPTADSVVFNDDGLKLFVICNSTTNIYEYDLTVAYSLATTITSWTLGAGWTISGGTANHAPGIASSLSQDISAITGMLYAVTYDVTNLTTGTVTPNIGGTDGATRTANGSYSEVIESGDVFPLIFPYEFATNNPVFSMVADASFDGSVGNITVHGSSPAGFRPRFTIVVRFTGFDVPIFPFEFPFNFGDPVLGILVCLFTKLKPANCDIIFENV